MRASKWTGKQIKGLRVRLELTQEEFANAVGVTFSTVNRWENEHARPSRLAVRWLDRAERELDVPPAQVA
jgi:DNA-binding transcriptional regulator YiaG